MAQQEAARIHDGTYIPSGVIPAADGGAFVHEGDDNVDINAETIDGKDTFHSMARVVFQQNGDAQTPDGSRIKRGSSKSLKLTMKRKLACRWSGLTNHQ